MNLELVVIGRIHSPFRAPEGAPVQPCAALGVEGVVELLPEFSNGLRDLKDFDRIWLLYWFHRAQRAQLEVVPYLDTQTHGIFATRAPSRPNPIGLSCVRLLGIDGTRLRVGELDVLDGTPLLDIKPYVPSFDSYVTERIGWLASCKALRSADGRFSAK